MARYLTPSEDHVFRELWSDLTLARPKFILADQYYDGAQRLAQLGLAIPPELMAFTVVVNWSRIAVDSSADRLDVKGFRTSDDGDADKELWRLWKRSDMARQEAAAHLDYLIYGRCFRGVTLDGSAPLDEGVEDFGGGMLERGPSRVVNLSAYDTTVRRDEHGTPAVALRVISRGEADIPRQARLYLPGRSLHVFQDGGAWVAVAERDEGPTIPIVAAYRSERVALRPGERLQGTSLLSDVAQITDSAARVLTNAQLAQETHAVPARGVLGASKGDFVDAGGNLLPTWEAYFGSVWALGNENAKTFQFDASDMANFERMVHLYARQAAAVSRLPASYFGMPADDAASADAIRSREAPLAKAAERAQEIIGAADARVVAMAWAAENGRTPGELGQVETLWHDAGTPTYASRADAVVKLHATRDPQGRSLLPAEMAYEELGWSPERKRRALALREQESADPYLSMAVDGGAGAPAVR